jgi:hypothetical protein
MKILPHDVLALKKVYREAFEAADGDSEAAAKYILSHFKIGASHRERWSLNGLADEIAQTMAPDEDDED